MTNTLNLTWQTAGFATSTANTTQFWTTFGATSSSFGGGGDPTTTEVNTQVLQRSAGNLSNMWIRLTLNSTNAPGVTFTSRVNAGAGTQTCTAGAAATGAFTDSTHTDVLAAGAKVDIRSVPGTTGTFSMSINSFIFGATTNTITRLASNTDGPNANQPPPSTTKFMAIAGDMTEAGGFAAETTGVKCRQQKAGTFQNACVSVITNTITAATIFTGRINAGVGTISVSCTASMTGFFEDTTHTDAVTVGQDYDIKYVTGASGTIIDWNITAIDFASTTGDCQLVASTDTPITVLKSVTTNYGLAGTTATTSTTELNTEGLVNAAFTFSNLTILVTTNTVSAASTLTLRANVANPGSGPAASITASTSGVFSDTTNTYAAASTDLVDNQLITGAAGTSLIFADISIWATLPTSTLYVRAISDSVTTILATITGSG